ncbi:hypothetical protein ACN47E_007986 [Coniothyrium glycines]
MAETQASPYALLEESFRASPLLRQRKQLPHRTDLARTAVPLRRDPSYTTTATDDSESIPSSPPLPPSPGVVKGTDSGLPPTPPTLSQNGQPVEHLDQSPHAGSVINSLASKKSTLSTPVNARSPPTPDPSPPRIGASGTAGLERPPMVAYPSSRADSFQTAREDLSSEPSRSRSTTPVGERLSTVQENRGLGLAFERDENDITPTNHVEPYFPATPGKDADTTAGAQEDKGAPAVEDIPDREWNTELMRNVTIRRKRDSISSPRKDSPRKESARKTSAPTVTIVQAASPSPSTRTRRASSLRERVEASTNSPVTPSIENFAQSIGWPAENKTMAEEKSHDASNKRLSTTSTNSTRVEAMVIITPPRRTQTLRHSGRNMAYRRDVSSPAELGSSTPSNRDSLRSDDIPLHRLVHKRVSIVERNKRISSESDTLGYERVLSPSLSVRTTRTMDSSRHTLAHQESIRNVLQPAADILSRTSSITRSHGPGGSFHKRMASAPEAVRRTVASPGPRHFSQLSPPPPSPGPQTVAKNEAPPLDPTPTPVRSPKPHLASPTSRRRRHSPEQKSLANVNKSLPRLPVAKETQKRDREIVDRGEPAGEKTVPSALMERVRQLVAERESAEESTPVPASAETNKAIAQQESSPPMRRGSRSSRRHSGEHTWSFGSPDHKSLSPEIPGRPSLDRISTEEMARRSHEWRRPSEDHARLSFDMTAARADEHALGRHLNTTTPYSQFSDTLEVSEATAVSIFPHNNNSLLVVQQVSRGSSYVPVQHQLTNDVHLMPEDPRDTQMTPTPPFVDASDGHEHVHELTAGPPALHFEPSTPPMQFDLPQPNGVDSPLKNPRAPPEPPKIMFIPPTPADELDKQLAPVHPGPPERSDSHPQRRLSLAQRARRYSDNLIPTLLGRTSSKRGRYASDPHAHRNPRVPTVKDDNGALHPFWRPRGFWDDFDDTDSESEEDELPVGGDTSDIEDEPPAPPKRTNTFKGRLKGGLGGSGGFLVGNSLGLERHGTNKRRHHVTLPPHFPRSPRTSLGTGRPKILIQSPTMPLGAHSGGGIRKRGSRGTLRVDEDEAWMAPSRRTSWRQGRSLPGLKKYQVQYIGLSGVKDRLRERNAEKRRQKLRQSIGSRYYVEPIGPVPRSSS